MITAFQSVSHGDTKCLLRYIRSLQKNGFGEMLHAACFNAKVDIARMLIESGASGTRF